VYYIFIRKKYDKLFKIKKIKIKKKKSRRSRRREAPTLRGQRGSGASDAMDIDYEEKLNVRVKKFIEEYCVNNGLWPHVFGTLYVTGALQIQYNSNVITVGNPFAHEIDSAATYCIFCGNTFDELGGVEYYSTNNRKFGLYKCVDCKNKKLCSCCLLSTSECIKRKVTTVLILKSHNLYRDLINYILLLSFQ
jgi:hypothetical protein